MAEQMKAAPEEKLVECVVARNRNVDLPHPTKTEIVGYHPETNKPLTRAIVHTATPGETIKLPQDEYARLLKAGYLVDPDEVIAPLAEGSRSVETGE